MANCFIKQLSHLEIRWRRCGRVLLEDGTSETFAFCGNTGVMRKSISRNSAMLWSWVFQFQQRRVEKTVRRVTTAPVQKAVTGHAKRRWRASVCRWGSSILARSWTDPSPEPVVPSEIRHSSGKACHLAWKAEHLRPRQGRGSTRPKFQNGVTDDWCQKRRRK